VTAWLDVQIGDIVAGSNDSMWSVEAKAVGEPGFFAITLKNCSSGREVSAPVPQEKDVKILISAQAAAEAAEALLQVRLGGQVVGRNEHGVWMTPDIITHAGAMLAHLYLFHDGLRPQDTDGRTIEQLTADHHAMHQRCVGTKEPHVHDPDWLKGRTA
jgi:hypothetical protein